MSYDPTARTNRELLADWAAIMRTLGGPIRDVEYAAVVIVIFDEDLRVMEGLRLERATVEELFSHRAHVNGRVITVTKRLREHPDVRVVELSDASLVA